MGELILKITAATKSGSTDYSADIANLTMWMAIIAGIACIVTWIGGSFMNWAFERIGIRFKTAYIRSLVHQEIGFYDAKQTGILMSYMTESMEQIQDSFSNKLGRGTQFFVQTILGVILALVFSWKMALVMLSFSPVVVLLLVAAGAASQIITKRTLRISNEASAMANEVIGSMRTIRSMDGEEKEIARYENKLMSGKYLYLLKAGTLGLPIGAMELSIWGVLAMGMWWGGQLLQRGEIEFGNMFRVFTLLLISVLGCSQIMVVIPDLSRALRSGLNILKVIYREPAIRANGGIQPDSIQGRIEFKNVSFSYPTRPNIQVLKNFSLTIEKGQAVALVGGSGSGKSTIVSLIERFYEPLSGEIYLDGNKLQDIDPRWLHRNVGIVTQEPTLFATTIKENIVYAVKTEPNSPTPSDEEIIKAAIAANAHDFISSLPNGYNTVLGERGVSLSGGQKQRIAIARAVIQNPSVLLLDESTSALDTASEAIVQEALSRLMKGRTSIVIAHRLSTIVDSDVICVMSKGELKEKGRHEELLSIPNGYYFQLAKKQIMMGSASSTQLDSMASQENLEDIELKETKSKESLHSDE